MRNARSTRISMVLVGLVATMFCGYAETDIPQKTVRLIIEETYVNPHTGQAVEGVASPIDRALVERLLGYADLRIITPEESETTSSDYTLRIKMEGKALGGNYGSLSPDFYFYTGASISGTMTLSQLVNPLKTEASFTGTISPPHSIPIYSGSRNPLDSPFKEALLSSDFTVKLATILGDIFGTPFLVNAQKDLEAKVRRTAALLLGKRGDVRAVEPLIAALRDEDSGVRYAAAETLSNIGDIAIEPLIEALNDKDWNVRQYAASILGNIGNVQAVGPLIEVLGNKNEQETVRGAAAEALGKLSDTRAIEPLIAALRDENSGVRYAAAEALGTLGDTRAAEPLIAALQDGDFGVRASAAEALGKLSEIRAVEPLIGALKDEYPSVRYAAAEALGNIKDERAIWPLIGALRNESEYVKQCITEALQKITNQSIGPAYKDWAAWWEQNKEVYQ